MPDDRRRPPRPPDPPDDELRESFELLATVAASVSDRVEGQSTALDRMAKVLAETRSAAFAARKHTDPARTAEQVAGLVEDRLGGTLHALSSTAQALAHETAKSRRLMDEIQGLRTDAALLRVRETQHAREWRRRLLLWGPSILLAAMLLTAIAAPRLLATHEGLCEIVGTTWVDRSNGRSSCWFDAWW